MDSLNNLTNLDPEAAAAIETAPLGAEVGLDILARRLPKAELHLHFEGAVRPSTLHRFAHQCGARLADGPAPDSPYDYSNFTNFIKGMRMAASLMRDAPSVTGMALDVLAGCVDAGCRHVELMTTLNYHRERGFDPQAFLRALAAAFEQAAEFWGLGGGIIVEMDRPAGVEMALADVRDALAARDQGAPMLGVGNDGSPLTVPLGDLAPAYELAGKEGLRLCGHADLPQDVGTALDMGFDRIDHGFFAAFDPALLDRIKQREVPLTLCPTSNIIQLPGLFSDFSAHPIGTIMAAGVQVTLNSDDPPMFFTDLAQEYRATARSLGWGAEEMANAARQSLQSAWLGEDRERKLREWEHQIAALLQDPRRSALPAQT